MAADNFLSVITSRPFRIAALVLLLIISFYLANPFAQTAFGRGQAHSSEHESQSRGNSSLQEVEQSTSLEHASAYALGDIESSMRQATMIYSSSDAPEVYERAVASHIRHGDRWGVPTHILRHDIVEAGFFNKPAYLLGLVIDELSKPEEERAEWIVWFDADSILFNPEVPWSIFLPPPELGYVNFLGTKDQNGFNAGMLFVRVDTWSVNMLAQVLTLRDNHPEIPLGFADQSALAWLFERPGIEERVIFQPHNWWNSFGLQGEPFDHDRFVLHFAGVGCCGGDDKATTMTRWLDVVEKEPNRFVKPLKELNLQAEIKEFWETAITAHQLLNKAQEWSKESKYNSKDFLDARQDLRTTLLASADDLEKMKAGITRLRTLKKKTDSKW